LLGQFQQFWIDALLTNRKQRNSLVLQPEVAAFQSRLDSFDQDSESVDQDSDSIRGASIRALTASTACPGSWTFPWTLQGWTATDNQTLSKNILKLVKKRLGVVTATLQRLEKERGFLNCSLPADTATPTKKFEAFWIGQSLDNRATRSKIFEQEQERLLRLESAASAAATAENVAAALRQTLEELNNAQSNLVKNNNVQNLLQQRPPLGVGRRFKTRRNGRGQRRNVRKQRSRRSSRD